MQVIGQVSVYFIYRKRTAYIVAFLIIVNGVDSLELNMQKKKLVN